MPKQRILIVDDVLDWQKTLSILLTDEDYDVVAVGDENTALETIKTEAEKFDLAIVDVRLDETNEDDTSGLELAEKLKEAANLPVIIITGYETQDTIARAFKQVSVVDFVPKTEAIKLVSRVKETLDKLPG